MAAPQETIWRMEAHTGAKHRILREWWNGWLPILASRHPVVVYFEGFAGPGVYLAGEPGSPVIALKCALDHALRPRFEKRRAVFYLVEKRQDRVDRLKLELAALSSGVPPHWDVHVEQGDFVETLEPVLDDLERKRLTLAPTYAFLDPFGFKDLPMDLVARMLAYKWCDVLVTFVARDINRFAESPLHAEGINRCLGGTSWRAELPTTPEERRAFFLKMYQAELKRRVPEAHVRSFEVSGSAGPIYYLVGATKHKEGVKVMKRAMWTADPTGNYRFSDRTAGTRTLLEWEDEPSWGQRAANAVYAEFACRRARLEDVEDFVLLRTPWLFKKRLILGRLERDGRLSEVIGRGRGGGWPGGSTLVFQ